MPLTWEVRYCCQIDLPSLGEIVPYRRERLLFPARSVTIQVLWCVTHVQKRHGERRDNIVQPGGWYVGPYGDGTETVLNVTLRVHWSGGYRSTVQWHYVDVLATLVWLGANCSIKVVERGGERAEKVERRHFDDFLIVWWLHGVSVRWPLWSWEYNRVQQ